MPKAPQSKPAKPSGARTALSFAVDLSLCALLIWFFATGDNTVGFWQGAGSLFNQSANFVFDAIHRTKSATPVIVKTMEPPSPVNHVPPSATLPVEEAPLEIALGPGDAVPPEAVPNEPMPPVTHLFYRPPPLPKQTKRRTGKGKPVQFEKRKVKGVPCYITTVNLNDPETFLVLRLPNRATKANCVDYTAGHETFNTFVKEYPGAVLVNGTFFSKDAQERVMGNMVSEGKTMKYSQWESYGTTLALKEGDVPEMVTARAEGLPNFDEHWFSITCGPRLIKQGEVWLDPALEGFKDPHVLGIGPRAAMGFPKSRDKLFIVTFLQGLSLEREAELMKAIGCYEAMNLDGGASKALSHNAQIVMKPGRGLTNVIVVYDTSRKAPKDVVAAWDSFQKAERSGL